MGRRSKPELHITDYKKATSIGQLVDADFTGFILTRGILARVVDEGRLVYDVLFFTLLRRKPKY